MSRYVSKPKPKLNRKTKRKQNKRNQVIQVVLKRRKYLIRSSIGPCFSGSNAVDVLHRHLQLHPGIFPNLEMMGRSNCVRLCQRFLDLRVFFPSKDKSSALKILFEDSNFVFYRFNYNNDFIGKQLIKQYLWQNTIFLY